MEAYCAKRDEDSPWCYVSGGKEGKKCKGAIKTRGGGEFYWTKDADICRAAESNRQSSEK